MTQTADEDLQTLQHAPPRQSRSQTLVLLIVGAVAVAIVFTLFSLVGRPGSTYENIAQNISTDGALVLGDFENAPIRLWVFLDFSDISSARLHKTLLRLVGPYIRPGKAVLIEHLLIQTADYYAESLMAAEAVYCASEQGAVWQLHDTLFGLWEQQFDRYGQIQAPPPAYANLGEIELAARQVSIEPQQLKACINEGRQRSMLDGSYNMAEQMQVSTIPAVYINETVLTDENGQAIAEPTFEQIKAAIEAILQESES